MFARALKSAIMVSVVAFLAVARGVPSSTANNQCGNGGALQCCQGVVGSSSPAGQAIGELLGMLGIGSIVGDIGLECTPISVVGIASGASCEKQAVCCTDVTQNGLINVGCSPFALGL